VSDHLSNCRSHSGHSCSCFWERVNTEAPEVQATRGADPIEVLRAEVEALKAERDAMRATLEMVKTRCHMSEWIVCKEILNMVDLMEARRRALGLA
jgi:hypothetical protein